VAWRLVGQLELEAERKIVLFLSCRVAQSILHRHRLSMERKGLCRILKQQ
jgi:hypothetical protein